jgi:NADH:ubiquinone oxidoreductase subunit K
MTPLHAYLLVAVVLFGLGVLGVVLRRSLIAILISLELMLAAAALNVVALTSLRGSNLQEPPASSVGQVVVLILIGVAAAEAAIALSLFVAIQRRAHSINVEDLSGLKG